MGHTQLTMRENDHLSLEAFRFAGVADKFLVSKD